MEEGIVSGAGSCGSDGSGGGGGNFKSNPIRVGFYDIERTIGRGNFAVVKLAKHRITKTEVVIEFVLFFANSTAFFCSSSKINLIGLDNDVFFLSFVM